MYPDPYEGGMEDVILNYKKEHHWRIVFSKIMVGWIIINKFYMLRRGISTLR